MRNSSFIFNLIYVSLNSNKSCVLTLYKDFNRYNQSEFTSVVTPVAYPFFDTVKLLSLLLFVCVYYVCTAILSTYVYGFLHVFIHME